MQTILVTGGAGFIGSHTAKKLIEQGHRVILLDNFNDYYDPSLKEARVHTMLSNVSYTLYRVDLANRDSLRHIFQTHHIDHIVHLAAQAGVRYAMQNPLIYAQTNIMGSIHLLELAKEFHVSGMTIASSSSVYGNASHYPIKETDETSQPISLYAATKKSLEVLAFSYHHLYQLPITCLRYFTVYGPWGRPDMAPYKFTESILNQRTIGVFGHGNMERDFTYIDDIVEGTLKAVEKNLPWEILNLGQGSPDTLGRFIELIETNCGKQAQKNMLPMQPGDVVRTYADNSRARQLLDWEPKVKLDEGIEQFVKWYRDYHHI